MHRHTLKINGVKLISAMESIPDTPEGIILESLLEGLSIQMNTTRQSRKRRWIVFGFYYDRTLPECNLWAVFMAIQKRSYCQITWR